MKRKNSKNVEKQNGQIKNSETNGKQTKDDTKHREGSTKTNDESTKYNEESTKYREGSTTTNEDLTKTHKESTKSHERSTKTNEGSTKTRERSTKTHEESTKTHEGSTKTREDSMPRSTSKWIQPRYSDNDHESSKSCDKTEQCSDTSIDDGTHSENIFPENTHWVVFILTLLFRIIYVSDKLNWWILHPDEIFQSLEIAHSEIYGYGFRPYEYMPPPDGADNITSGSVSSEQEYKLGMYSLRSFMFPTIFTIIGKAAIFFGWQKSPYVIWKIFHAAVTSCLPLSVYRFVMITHASRDIATMASILVASSIHMNVFGTHTFINSFLSPILFYSLSELMKLIFTSEYKQVDKYSSNEGFSELYDTYSESRGVPHKSDTHPKCITERRKNQNENEKKLSRLQKKPAYKTGGAAISNYKRTQFEQKNEHCCYMNGDKLKAVKHMRSSKRKIISGYSFRLFFKGLLFGITVYVRIDSCLLLFLWFLPYLSSFLRNLKRNVSPLQSYAAGSIVGVGICMCDDVIRYNAWVLSIWQWINFNIIQNLSSKLFGTKTLTFYFEYIVFHDFSMCLLFLLTVLYAILSFFNQRKLSVHSGVTSRSNTRNIDMKLSFTISVLFIIYSLRGHKELRFLHDGIVLLLVVYSSVVIHACQVIQRNVTCVRQTTVLWSVIMLYIASQWNNFPSYTDKSNADWSYGKYTDSNYVNICLDFLSSQNDVRGVYIDASIHVTGGYTILHQNVPIISLIHKEFYEFGMESRIIMDKKNRNPISNDIVSLATLRRISDFISIRNTQYLLKMLIKHAVYNYLIIGNEREFLRHGYSEVFRSGTMRILKRNFQPEQEMYLRHLAVNIPPGPDVFTLNYEANWLLTYALYDKAEYKLLYSLKLYNKNLQTYQLLVRLYEDQKKPEKVKKMLNFCKQYFYSIECAETPKRIVMHKEYNLDVGI